jgi:hypothetical protein
VVNNAQGLLLEKTGNTNYHHRKLFDSLEYRYRIGERLTLYCKKLNAIDYFKEYCINI